MANSRKSRGLNKQEQVEEPFERALEDILARVSVLDLSCTPVIAVAYSGGLDSSVLLHLASRFAKERGIALYAFHIHHGFSPNADAWQMHCADQACKCKVEFLSARVNVKDIDKHGVEQAARIARYQALRDMCTRHQINVLLTAHHQDDQAESILLQLLRGAGLRGLSGMSAFQHNHDLLGEGIALARPLIDISRAALEEFAAQRAIPFISDESNNDIRYRRNALRHRVFPGLHIHFPGFPSLLGRSATHIQAAQSLLEELAEIDLERCKAGSSGIALECSKLSELSSLRTDNLLRYWLHRQGIQMPSSALLEQIRSQILLAQPDKHPAIDLGAFTVQRVSGCVELRPDLGSPPTLELMLKWQGEQMIHVPQWRGSLIFEQAETHGIAKEHLLSGPLLLKPRTGHEKLKLAQNRPSRTLKNLFQEAAVPAWQRKWLPTLYLGDHLIFVAGIGMDVRHCSNGESVALRWKSDD